MPVQIVALDVVVVVLPIARATVVRRINVDRVDGMLMCKGKLLQYMEILTVYDRLEWFVDAALDGTIRLFSF